MSDYRHEHRHHDRDHLELSQAGLRVRALESILTKKGQVDPAAPDLLIETCEKKVGPRNGACVAADPRGVLRDFGGQTMVRSN